MMMSRKYYLTTPIYYSNGVPHIGHAYTSLLGDIIARAKRLIGYDVKYSTGVDENSQKILQEAKKQNKDVYEFLDDMAAKHRSVWDGLDISYTDFIRTTDPKHKEFVQKILDKTYKNGDIYKGEYKGLYCVGCEAFLKKDDLTDDGLCPNHLVKPQEITEQNYFFKLSKYQKDLEKLYFDNPDFVIPASKFNEIKSFVSRGLEDFSISRETHDFGIPLPFDTEQVTYVWYDALLNYMTVCQDGDEDFWPADLHMMAKDIARFHAIYWPAMLMAVSLPVPKQELVTGYLTVEGQKISKSLGNVIDPVQLCDKYSRDALVYYFFSDLVVGHDGDFSRDRFKGVYNGVLLGGRGNLVSRVSKLAQKNNINKGKYYEQKFNPGEYENPLTDMIQNGFDEQKFINVDNLQQYMRNWYDLVQYCNVYINDNKPWEKLKSDDDQIKQDGIQDLEFLLYMIKQIALLSAPFLIQSFAKVQEILGNDDIKKIISGIDANLSENEFKKIFDLEDFGVNLSPAYLYTKIED